MKRKTRGWENNREPWGVVLKNPPKSGQGEDNLGKAKKKHKKKKKKKKKDPCANNVTEKNGKQGVKNKRGPHRAALKEKGKTSSTKRIEGKEIKTHEKTEVTR